MEVDTKDLSNPELNLNWTKMTLHNPPSNPTTETQHQPSEAFIAEN